MTTAAPLPEHSPDGLTARLTDVHAQLASARDSSDILAAIADCAADYGPAWVDLRYLYLGDDGQPDAMQALAVWQDGALVPDHPFLGTRLRVSDTTLSRHWIAAPREVLVIPDVTTDERCDDHLRHVLAPRRAVVVLPLHSAHPAGWQGRRPPVAGPAHPRRQRAARLQDPPAQRRRAGRQPAQHPRLRGRARRGPRPLPRVRADRRGQHPADLLAVITDLALSAGAAQGTLLLAEPGAPGAEDTILVAAAHAVSPELEVPVGARHPASAMPAWDIWRRDPDAPVTIDDIADDPRVDSISRAFHDATGIRAVLLLPLRWQERAIGWVHLGWLEPHRFSAAERRLFRGLARQAAAVLDNRLLWDRTQRAIQDNRTQQQTLEILLDHLPIGVTVVDTAGKRKRINRAGLAIHDLGPDALAGDKPPELLTYHLGTDRRIAHDERLSIRSMAAGELLSGELEVERRDGRRIIVAGTAAPSRDEHGEITGCVLLYQDITGRIAAERERSRVQDAILAAQAAALAERATPLIPLTDEILVMPIVGTIDPERGDQIQTALLALDGRTAVRAAILDLTGVPTLDEPGARALLAAARGLRLRGVVPILSGVRPDVAWTLVSLESALGELLVEHDLQSALARAQRLGPR
jgi:PAS domain S-box-containing protein